jgi:hypothetical protein
MMRISLPGSWEDSHQLFERLERRTNVELDIVLLNVVHVCGEGRVVVRVEPLPRGRLAVSSQLVTRLQLNSDCTYALIVVMEYPREPLQVRLDDTIGRTLAYDNTRESITHDLRNSTSLNSTPNFWR